MRGSDEIKYNIYIYMVTKPNTKVRRIRLVLVKWYVLYACTYTVIEIIHAELRLCTNLLKDK